MRLEKPEAFTGLVKIITSQIGSLVNITELSSTLGIADKTIRHYLWYLEQTFILKKVTPYYRNTRKEITKAPIYYFLDIGLRNYLLGIFGLSSIPPVLSGYLFENLVFNILRKRFPFLPTQLHFWRTRDNAEVDFVLQTDLQVIPVEVKYKKMDTPEITRSYRSFLTQYKPQKGYIVHLGGKQEVQVDGINVFLLPYYSIDMLEL